MPRDIRIVPEAGQRVIVDTRSTGDKITRTVTAKTKDLQSTYISGEYVEPVPDPPPTSYPVTLQEGIDGTPVGGTLDLTGGPTYHGSFTIRKPLKIVSPVIRGPQFQTYVAYQGGLRVLGLRATPLAGVRIIRPDIQGFGDIGIRADFVDDLLIEGALVQDCVYGGIGLHSARNSRVAASIVRRIGIFGSEANSRNAYGIYFTQQDPSTDYRSSDCLADLNLVEDVPMWHGFDTHGGLRVTFRGNTARRCRFGVYVTSGGVNATDVDVDGNLIEEHRSTNPDGAGYGVTMVYASGGYIRNNRILSYSPGREIGISDGGVVRANPTQYGNVFV